MTHASSFPVQKNSTTDRLFPGLRSAPRVPLGSALPDWFSARWAASLFATPRAAEPSKADHAFLATGTALSVQGLAAWRWGSGPAVFLVHGWEGYGAQLRAFVEPLVNHGFSVVAFDAKAHGASPGVEATLSDFASALLALEARFGSPAAVVAHSLGALGTLLALRRGLAARAAVLIAIPSPRERLAAFRKELDLTDSAVQKMMSLIEKRVGVPWNGVEAPALATGVSTAVLVVHDDADRIASRATADAAVRALSNGALYATSGLGHRRIVDDRAVVDTVTSFVEAAGRGVPAPTRAADPSFPEVRRNAKRRHLPVPVGSAS